MREDRNPARHNQFEQQQRRDQELDRLEFGSDFFGDLPDQADRIVTRDRNLDRNNNRTK